MSDGTDFSTNFILDAFRRIHAEKLTGFLSFPYEDDLSTLTFLGGEFVAIDTQTGRKYLVPFLAERGIDLSRLIADSTSAIAVADLQAAQQATLEFVGRVMNRLADPAVGVLLNFQAKDAASLSASVPGVPAANLVLQFFDKWLESRLLPAMQPDPGATIRVNADRLRGARTLALTPRQGFILARLQDGLTVRDFISSCGMPEDQVVRDLLAFTFFGILAVGEPPRKAGAPPPPPQRLRPVRRPRRRNRRERARACLRSCCPRSGTSLSWWRRATSTISWGSMSTRKARRSSTVSSS